MARYDDLAPKFILDVANQELPNGVLRLIKSVTYESSDGVADVLKIIAANPDFELSEAKMFMPGNEINVWMGYGEPEFIGRAVIAKAKPNFPNGGIPTLELTGYTYDYKMMDNAPEKSKTKDGKSGRVWTDTTYNDVVADKAADYGLDSDIDEMQGTDVKLIQKAGVSDYQFVQGIANLNGFVWWVDGDQEGKWTLNLKDPKKIYQEKEYALVYNDGDYSALFDFSPEISLRGATTKLKVQTKNPETGKLIEEEFEEDIDSIDVVYSKDPKEKVEEELTTPAAIKIFIDDFSFEIISNKKFKTAAELKVFAQQWFRKMRENFIQASGSCIGIETLRARQIHTIDGVGKVYSGKYYFSVVRHIMDSSGYRCEFSGRKVIE